MTSATTKLNLEIIGYTEIIIEYYWNEILIFFLLVLADMDILQKVGTDKGGCSSKNWLPWPAILNDNK